MICALPALPALRAPRQQEDEVCGIRVDGPIHAHCALLRGTETEPLGAPDPGVTRWQERIERFWKPIAGGCHLTRRMPELIDHVGFTIDNLGRFAPHALPARRDPSAPGRITSGVHERRVDVPDSRLDLSVGFGHVSHDGGWARGGAFPRVGTLSSSLSP